MDDRWTPGMDRDFAHCWRAGMPVEQMENRFRISHETLAKTRLRLGLLPRFKGGWTPERELLAHKLYINDARSAAETARLLGHGLTRNAVIGIALRRGWKTKGRQQKSLPPIGPVTRRPPRPGPQNRPGVVFGAVSITDPEETDRKRRACQAEGERVRACMAEAANDTALRLTERGRFQCSWPVGEPVRPAEQMCCGQPVQTEGAKGVETYCARHALRAISRSTLGGKPDAKVYEKAMRRFA